MRHPQEWWVEHVATYLERREGRGGDGGDEGPPEDEEFERELDALIRDKLRYLRCAEANDVGQEVWSRVLKKQVLARFTPGSGSFEGFLGAEVLHAFLTDLKKKRRERKRTDPDIDLNGIADLLKSPGPPFDRDLWRATLRAIQKLSEQDQDLLKDAAEGMKHRELAKKYRKTIGGIGKRLFTLYRKLRSELEGGTPPDPPRRRRSTGPPKPPRPPRKKPRRPGPPGAERNQPPAP